MPKIIFIESNGNKIETEAIIGISLMKLAINAGVTGITAECGGACACGTCHCYIEVKGFMKLPSPEEDELDMLDFVIDSTEISRLSCQIAVTNEMDGLIVQIPQSQT